MRVLQLTNNAIGAVAVNTLMPLGTVTRKYCCGNAGKSTFAVSTSGANTITLNDSGYYKITYVGSLTAGAAGTIVLNLLSNNAVLTSSSATVAAGATENLVLSYTVRVLPSCSCVSTPLSIQLQNASTSVALTGGNSNITIEKIG